MKNEINTSNGGAGRAALRTGLLELGERGAESSLIANCTILRGCLDAEKGISDGQ